MKVLTKNESKILSPDTKALPKMVEVEEVTLEMKVLAKSDLKIEDLAKQIPETS